MPPVRSAPGRRAPEFRRSSRRRLPEWIWWLVGIFLVLGLMLFVLHHNQREHFRPPVVVSPRQTLAFLFNFCLIDSALAEFREIF
jgi:hypothetical protein